MILLSWDEVVALELGVLQGGGAITAVTADSREAGPGDLFVALNAGVEYVADARARGAATLVPDDQEAALAALASLVRSKSDAQVVAVVGSAGKTTTKDILGALCAPHARTIWAEKSLNNEIGLPLTVCRLEPETQILVTEMGMRGLGQISALCQIAQPDVVVVPHIGPEHLELLVQRRARRGGERGGDRVAAGGWNCGRAGAQRGTRAVPDSRRHRVATVRPGRRRHARRDDELHRRRRDDPAGAAVHAAPPRGEHARGAARLRRARSPARSRAGGRLRHPALAVAWRGDRAARRRASS